MKRFFAFLIAVMMLSTVFLTAGCSIVTRGSDYCYRFLDYICGGSFDKAYEMLADSIKAPETEEEREDRLKAEEKEKEENRNIWRRCLGWTRLRRQRRIRRVSITPAAEPPIPTQRSIPTPRPIPTQRRAPA